MEEVPETGSEKEVTKAHSHRWKKNVRKKEIMMMMVMTTRRTTTTSKKKRKKKPQVYPASSSHVTIFIQQVSENKHAN